MKPLQDYDLVLHIGQGKTGTSAIQSVLNEHKEQLDQQGFWYLGLELDYIQNRNKLLLDKKNIALGMDSQLYKTLDYELTNRDKTLLWSYEGLFNNLDALDIIKKLGSKFEVAIIAYIRRPDRWAESAYVQWGLKHKTYNGAVKSFEDFTSGGYVPNQFKCTFLWHNEFPESFILRNYDAIKNVSFDFLQLLNVDIKGLDISAKVNVKPSPEQIYALALYNSLENSHVLPIHFKSFLNRMKMTSMDINSLLDINMRDCFPTNQQLSDIYEKNQSIIKELNFLLEKNSQKKFEYEELLIRDSKEYSSENLIKLLMYMVFKLESRVTELESNLEK